jgi:CHAT domain-containing protein/tetratricopeptide (TPR) repeat protein
MGNRKYRARLASAAWLIGGLMSATFAACDRNPAGLTPLRESAAGDIGADTKVSWQIAVPADRLLLIEARQENFDFAVALVRADGRSLVEVDSPTKRTGAERLLYDAKSGGAYTVTLLGREHALARGRYHVDFYTVPRGFSGRLLDGYRAVTDAGQRFASANAEQRTEVVKLYEQAAVDFSQARHPELEAEVRYALAMLHYDYLPDWTAAIDDAEQSAKIFQERGNRRSYAQSIGLQAAALTERGKSKSRGASAEPDLDRAAVLLDRASAINLAEHDEFALARNHNDRGLNLLYRDKFAAAVDSFQQAVAIYRRLHERPSELMSLQDIATVQALRGDYRSAADDLERLLAQMDAKADPGAFADVCANSAFALAQVGETAAALRRYAQALDIQEAEADVAGQARSRQGIGNIYWRLGERERALEMFLATLPLREAADDHRGSVVTLVSIGNLYRELGQSGEAAQFHARALDYVNGNDMAPTDRMRVQIALAADRNATREFREAKHIIEAALDLDVPKDHPFQARALLERARAAAGVREFDVAVADLKKVIGQQSVIGASFDESMARVMLADILHQQRHRTESLAELDQALSQLESLRIQAAGPELRAAFVAARHDAYGQRVNVLLDDDRSAPETVLEALLTVERSHARSFLDGLNSRRESHREEGASKDGIAKLYEQLDGHELRLQQLMAQGIAPTDGRMVAMKSEMNLLRARIDARSSDDRSSSAASFDSVSTRADLVALQAKLRPGDVILNYLLSSPKSWLWVIGGGEMRVVELPDQKLIAAAAARLLKSLTRPPAGIDRELLDSGTALARQILWPARLPATVTRAIVIPDGPLLHVPFAALPSMESGDDTQRLVDRTELMTAYSLSTLQLLEQRRRDPPQNLPHDPEIMLVADPVFSADDVRLQSPARDGSNRFPTNKLLASLDVPRLPSTGAEADAIAKLVPPERIRLARGFDANPAVFDELQKNDYAILHFATHLRIDRDDPGLTSLLLSKLDANGKSLRGTVAAYEIASMQLHPQLVVLSACDSSMGRDLHGEGMLGLGRAFLLSGAQNVIATQWQVADRATSELMQRLYVAMLTEGQSPSAALRAAQMQMKNDKRWGHPYYWAGFVAYGSPGFGP